MARPAQSLLAGTPRALITLLAAAALLVLLLCAYSLGQLHGSCGVVDVAVAPAAEWPSAPPVLVRVKDAVVEELVLPPPAVAAAATAPPPRTAAAEVVHATHWIVVTSVSAPTETMERLCNLTGWQTVVVADKKTPATWAAGRCIFLSVAEQETRLGYRVVPLTPFRSYTRKNIGYLYAIAHGAQVVYDTDDDNRPRGGHVHEPPRPFTNLVSWFRNDSDALPLGNVYAHFGWPHIWPRGYPLAPPRDLEHPVPSPSQPLQTATPADVAVTMLRDGRMIVQNLADLDPDVDAVFRLTRGEELGHIRFCASVPALRLEPGLFSPFNSQNTVFYRDTLWALLLPKSVTFRVTDIWRAYWAQRLLWDVGGTVVFQGSSVDHERNVHDLHRDRDEEQMLYDDAERFVRLLDTWAPRTPTLPERMVELVELMVEHRLTGAEDAELMRAWVADLQAVGYVFPAVVALPRPMPGATVARWPPAPAERALTQEMLTRMELCALRRAWSPTLHPVFKDVLLICHFNQRRDHGSVPLYLDMYAPAFPNIVFVGQDGPAPVVPYDVIPYIHYDDSDPRLRGDAQHRGLAQMHRRFPDYKGYLWTNDDVLLNYWRLKDFDQGKFWYFNRTVMQTEFQGCLDVGRFPSKTHWHWHWNREIQQHLDRFRQWLAAKRAAKVPIGVDPTGPDGNICSVPGTEASPLITTDVRTAMPTATPTGTPDPRPSFYMYHLGADFIYAPSERVTPSARGFFELLELFERMQVVFMEIATPTSLYMAVPLADIQPLNILYNWDGIDAALRVLIKTEHENLHVFHPIKFGTPDHDALRTQLRALTWTKGHLA